MIHPRYISNKCRTCHVMSCPDISSKILLALGSKLLWLFFPSKAAYYKGLHIYSRRHFTTPNDMDKLPILCTRQHLLHLHLGIYNNQLTTLDSLQNMDMLVHINTLYMCLVYIKIIKNVPISK